MTNTITITDLTKVSKENNLPSNNAEALQAAFMPFFERAAEWRDKAYAIKVTNLAQTAEMGKAREARLALRDIRLQTEKERVKMKEESLRTGRAIDGMANVIKFLIAPIEQYLEDQEKYGERLREKMQAEMRDARECEAGKLLQYFPPGIGLGAIADEEFAKYLHYAKVQHKAVMEEAEKIERENNERMEREAAEREALRVENERLRKENELIEAQREIDRTAALIAKQQADAELAAERAEIERLRREAEAKEQAERERIAAENRAEMERDNAELERLRKEQELKEAAERAALEAPDKSKLSAYAQLLWDLPEPQFSTESGSEKFNLAAQKIAEAIKILQS